MAAGRFVAAPHPGAEQHTAREASAMLSCPAGAAP